MKIEEPDEANCLVMMRAVGPFLEKHHKVMITDEALLDAVRLSHRYISGRQLPDKAVSVLDTACARVAIGLHTIPPPVEAATRKIAHIDREMKILKRESLMGRDHAARMDVLESGKAEAQAELEVLRDRWEKRWGSPSDPGAAAGDPGCCRGRRGCAWSRRCPGSPENPGGRAFRDPGGCADDPDRRGSPDRLGGDLRLDGHSHRPHDDR